MGRRSRYLSPLTRREALGMLGAGTGLAFAAGCGGNSAPPAASGGAAMEEAAGAMPDIALPDGAVIRTILGDVDPASLAGGATLFHEHLDIRQGYAVPPPDPPRGLDEPLTGEAAEAFVELVAEELRMAAADGLSCVVDARHLPALGAGARVSAADVHGAPGWRWSRPARTGGRRSPRISRQ